MECIRRCSGITLSKFECMLLLCHLPTIHLNWLSAHPGFESLFPIHPKSALRIWDPVTVEATLTPKTHCFVPLNNLPLLFVTRSFILLKVTTRRWVHCSHKIKRRNQPQYVDSLQRLNDILLVPIVLMFLLLSIRREKPGSKEGSFEITEQWCHYAFW